MRLCLDVDTLAKNAHFLKPALSFTSSPNKKNKVLLHNSTVVLYKKSPKKCVYNKTRHKLIKKIVNNFEPI